MCQLYLAIFGLCVNPRNWWAVTGMNGVGDSASNCYCKCTTDLVQLYWSWWLTLWLGEDRQSGTEGAGGHQCCSLSHPQGSGWGSSWSSWGFIIWSSQERWQEDTIAELVCPGACLLPERWVWLQKPDGLCFSWPRLSALCGEAHTPAWAGGGCRSRSRGRRNSRNMSITKSRDKSRRRNWCKLYSPPPSRWPYACVPNTTPTWTPSSLVTPLPSSSAPSDRSVMFAYHDPSLGAGIMVLLLQQLLCSFSWFSDHAPSPGAVIKILLLVQW